MQWCFSVFILHSVWSLSHSASVKPNLQLDQECYSSSYVQISFHAEVCLLPARPFRSLFSWSQLPFLYLAFWSQLPLWASFSLKCLLSDSLPPLRNQTSVRDASAEFITIQTKDSTVNTFFLSVLSWSSSFFALFFALGDFESMMGEKTGRWLGQKHWVFSGTLQLKFPISFILSISYL